MKKHVLKEACFFHFGIKPIYSHNPKIMFNYELYFHFQLSTFNFPISTFNFPISTFSTHFVILRNCSSITFNFCLSDLPCTALNFLEIRQYSCENLPRAEQIILSINLKVISSQFLKEILKKVLTFVPRCAIII